MCPDQLGAEKIDGLFDKQARRRIAGDRGPAEHFQNVRSRGVIEPDPVAQLDPPAAGQKIGAVLQALLRQIDMRDFQRALNVPASVMALRD